MMETLTDNERRGITPGKSEGGLENPWDVLSRIRMMERATALELVVALAAVALGILGLVGLFPRHLAATAAILIGGGLMVEGAAIAARYRELLANEADTPAVETTALGTTVETLGGIGIVVLGILALVGLAPVTLLAIAALAFGATLWFGAPEVTYVGAAGPIPPAKLHARHQAARASAAVSAMAGMAVGVLGILVLARIGSMELILSAIIVAGGATLVRGGLFTTGTVRLMRQVWGAPTLHGPRA